MNIYTNMYIQIPLFYRVLVFFCISCFLNDNHLIWHKSIDESEKLIFGVYKTLKVSVNNQYQGIESNDDYVPLEISLEFDTSVNISQSGIDKSNATYLGINSIIDETSRLPSQHIPIYSYIEKSVVLKIIFYRINFKYCKIW